MNKYLFIGLMAVLIVIIVGFFAFALHLTEDVKIDVLGNGEIEEGESIHIKLTSKDGTPLEDKEVHVSILNKRGNNYMSQIPTQTLKTDSNGKISYSQENLTKGEYTIKVTFRGDDKYSANETTEKIKIIEKKVIETTPQETTPVSESTTAETESDSTDFKTPLDDDPYVVEYDEYHGVSENIKYYTYPDGSVVAISDDGHYVTQFSGGGMAYGYI